MSKQCIIQILDEVNCKVAGLDLVDRKKLSKKFEHDIPGARYSASVRLGRWSGKMTYFQISGSTYVNLLPEILPVLDEAGYDIQLDDKRQPHPQMTFSPVTEETFKHKAWPEKHPLAGSPVILRDYQIDIVNRFLSNPQSLQIAATGAGKTLITAALSQCVEEYGRSIIIVPNTDLVHQTEADYINLGLDVGAFYGGRKDIGKQHTICTWQSLNALLKKTKAGEAEFTIQDFLENVVCVIVDEVHGAKAAALREILTGVMANVPIRWGLTGTLPKAAIEATALFISLGHPIGQLAASELQEQGVLAQCHVNIIQLDDHVDLGNYQAELKYLLENSDRLDKIAELITKISESGNTLVLIDRINPGKELVSRIPGAVFVSGATATNDRKEEYDEVATSTNKVICASYGVAAVGLNLPRIFNLVLIEPGKSFVRTIQSIGRGLRKAADKDSVTIYDITSNCKFAKRHLTQRKAFYKEAQYPHTVEKLKYK